MISIRHILRCVFAFVAFAVSANAQTAPVRGLFIGSFDPITNAHVQVVRAGIEQLGLTEVVLVVNSASGKDYSASVEERMKMVEAAVTTELDPRVRFVIVDEPAVGKREFAIELAKDARGGTLYQIAGDDVQSKAKELFGDLSQVKSYILPRLDESGRVGKLLEGFNLLNSTEPSALSSTEVKRRRLQGLSIRGMVPDAVTRIIQRNQLYSPLSQFEIAQRRSLINAQVRLLVSNAQKTDGIRDLNFEKLIEVTREANVSSQISTKTNLELNPLQSQAAVEELLARRLVAANPELNSVDAHGVREWVIATLNGRAGTQLKRRILIGGKCADIFAP